eukprot:7389556-Pyramimonas_sp.AAC.1
MLLRHLQRQCPTSTIRACADDNAVVLRSFWKDAPVALAVYKQSEQFSGLRLNMAKTIVLPLWETTQRSFERAVKDMLPQWALA